MISDLYPQLEFFHLFAPPQGLLSWISPCSKTSWYVRDLNLSVRGLVCFGVWLVQSVKYCFHECHNFLPQVDVGVHVKGTAMVRGMICYAVWSAI